ncbi:Protein with similarity to mammalian ELMO [Komagataella phaffii CBS 7435]|uniref:Protein with similarity to mammalian ELMO n=1 Tax=Komagataella phaffii (strain ATCC 76273 / CBS 7435 / CECT 11047 / NRRL Y-11430 / Wegner 21-1) TaxID=981350 RepID=F2QVJ2_KOMPC|nr:GQ67_03831T0 [Komagataella phaffii]AOA68311.1 GQ68_03804T0 [Komagataella phaffii GS115]CAH2449433.1 Protein with similarity to mammalian ELMO [Komagataella phaffii CBS 7435]CCA39420.1 Protein with similarity to mammalian ELMO [Komagataella phaffii CBS 7435]
MTEGYRKINNNIKELLSQDPLSRLDETSSIQYSESLCQYLINSKDKTESINIVVVLLKVLDISPSSEKLTSLFTKDLLHYVLEITTQLSSPESVRSVVKLLIFFVSGNIFKAHPVYRTLLDALIEKEQYTSSLASMLPIHDSKLPATILDFYYKMLYIATESRIPELAMLYRNLKRGNFYTGLLTLKYEQGMDMDAAFRYHELIRCSHKAELILFETKIQLKYDCHNFIFTLLLQSLNTSLNENGTPATKGEFVRAGFTDNPQKFILSKLSVLSALQFNNFLLSLNVAFKKTYFEQLMFSQDDRCFPIIEVGIMSSDKLYQILNTDKYPSLKQHTISSELLYTNLMGLALRIWKDSQADTSDLQVISVLLDYAMIYLEQLISQNENYTVAIQTVHDLTYEELRVFQRNQIKKSHKRVWKEETHSVSKIIHKEVLEFIKEERFLQLSHGSWVYSENPIEAAANNKKPRSYFMILSPNIQSIIYKEYTDQLTTKPNIDSNGAVLDLSKISRIVAIPLQHEESVPENSRLISLASRTFYERIDLISKQNQIIFTFYTSTKEASYTWSDGLKFLTNSTKDLSPDTRKQISDLQSLRESIQLLKLGKKESQQLSCSASDSAPSYDASRFDTLLTGFYYT